MVSAQTSLGIWFQLSALELNISVQRMSSGSPAKRLFSVMVFILHGLRNTRLAYIIRALFGTVSSEPTLTLSTLCERA